VVALECCMTDCTIEATSCYFGSEIQEASDGGIIIIVIIIIIIIILKVISVVIREKTV
jgi:hypothetical protein